MLNNLIDIEGRIFLNGQSDVKILKLIFSIKIKIFVKELGLPIHSPPKTLKNEIDLEMPEA